MSKLQCTATRKLQAFAKGKLMRFGVGSVVTVDGFNNIGTATITVDKSVCIGKFERLPLVEARELLNDLRALAEGLADAIQYVQMRREIERKN